MCAYTELTAYIDYEALRPKIRAFRSFWGVFCVWRCAALEAAAAEVLIMAEDTAQAAATTDVGDAQAATGDQAQPDKLPAWAEKEIKALRDEAAKSRIKLKSIEDAQLTEQERISKRAAELETEVQNRANELRQERAEREVERLARTLNIVDEETALALVRGRIEFDDAGKPTNARALLEDLVTKKPFLVNATAAGTARTAATTSTANPSRSGASVGEFTREQIADRRFWEANRDAIMQAHAEGRIK